MSTSPAPETTESVGQDPSSNSNTGQTSSESQLEAADHNISEQTIVTKTELQKQEVPLNVQTESNDPSVETKNSIESKVTSTARMESNTQPDSKIPEVNEIDTASEKKVQVEEIEKTSENNDCTSNTHGNINDSITTNDKNEITKTGGGENAMEAENPALNNENPSILNGNRAPKEEAESENLQQNEDTDTSECINIQELTEHVMNILNDDEVVENVMSEQQLLKKNIDLQQFIVKLIHLLKEKTDLCANLDRQNSALISQAKSLKDVIAITKDLLGIRNMEIEHLHADMAAMEETIKEERNRQNLSVQRLNEAMSLNDKLKTEYLNQMDLFQKLREKYNEKVVYLTKENQRLNGLMNPETKADEAITNEMNDQSNQIESVDK